MQITKINFNNFNSNNFNSKTRLHEQNQKKILVFFHYYLNRFICCKTELKIKLIFYRMNSFATFEQPYFCCKTKQNEFVL